MMPVEWRKNGARMAQKQGTKRRQMGVAPFPGPKGPPGNGANAYRRMAQWRSEWRRMAQLKTGGPI